jgi:hypothetical protein
MEEDEHKFILRTHLPAGDYSESNSQRDYDSTTTNLLDRSEIRNLILQE